MLREYFSCNERLEIFLTYFCNILCYVGAHSPTVFVLLRKTKKGVARAATYTTFLFYLFVFFINLSTDFGYLGINLSSLRQY